MKNARKLSGIIILACLVVFGIMACNDGSTPTSSSISTGGATALAVPVNTRVEAVDSSLLLRWDLVAGAASYTVDFGNGRTETVTGTEYSLLALTLDPKLYTFKVRANAGGNANYTNSAFSETYDCEIADYIFTKESNHIIITGLTKFGETLANIVIPSMIGGVDVTTIGDNAFAGNAVMVAVTISETVSTVGAGAFSGNTALKNVVFTRDTGATEFGAGVFSGSNSIENIFVPEDMVAQFEIGITTSTPEIADKITTEPPGNIHITTVYFVNQTGSDSNNGTSSATALATVNRALELIRAAYAADWPGKAAGNPVVAEIVISDTVSADSHQPNPLGMAFIDNGNSVYPPLELRGLSESNPGTVDAAGKNKPVIYIDGVDVTLGSNLTLSGSGTAPFFGTAADRDISRVVSITGGSFTMTGGTIRNARSGIFTNSKGVSITVSGGTVTNNRNGIELENDAEDVNITVTGTALFHGNIALEGGGIGVTINGTNINLEIDGGKIENNEGNAVNIGSGSRNSQVVISGTVEITENGSGTPAVSVQGENNTLNISGGTISGSRIGVFITDLNNTVNMTGGTISDNNDNPDNEYRGNGIEFGTRSRGNRGNNVVNISGGTISGHNNNGVVLVGNDDPQNIFDPDRLNISGNAVISGNRHGLYISGIGHEVTVGGDAEIKDNTDDGIGVGNNSEDIILNITGGAEISGNRQGLSVNGTGHEITISENAAIIENTERGIVLASNSSNVELTVNGGTISRNDLDGIVFSGGTPGSQNHTAIISGNAVISNNRSGLELSGSGHEITISGNAVIMENTENGISITGSDIDLVMEGGTISDNNNGVRIGGSVGENFFNMKNGTIKDNSSWGLAIRNIPNSGFEKTGGIISSISSRVIEIIITDGESLILSRDSLETDNLSATISADQTSISRTGDWND